MKEKKGEWKEKSGKSGKRRKTKKKGEYQSWRKRKWREE